MTNSKWDFETEPNSAGARRVVRSVWVPRIPKPSAGARSPSSSDDDDDNIVLFGSVNIAAESSFYANDPCGLGVCLPDGASNVFFNAKYQMKPQMSFLMQNIPRICAIHVKVTTRYSLLTSMTTYYLIKNLGSDLVTLSLSVFSCD